MISIGKMVRGKGVANLETVVDVQTGNHHQEAISVNTSNKSLDDVGIPRLMRIVDQTIHSIPTQKRDSKDVQPAEGDLIIFLSLLLGLSELVLIFKHNHIREERKERSGWWWAQADIDRLGDLPRFQEDSETLAGKDHPGSVLTVIQEVQEDNRLHENVGKNGAN